MQVVVPFDVQTPKTRLAEVLDEAERAAFARMMLRDVLGALRDLDREPVVLANGPLEVDATVTIDDRSLTKAVNGVLAEATDSVAIVMADLALATPSALDALFEATGDVILVPGRGGGTNALLTHNPDFRVDYHGVSIRDHRQAAHELAASVTEVDSARLSTDIDEGDDLPEVLLHGTGHAANWLAKRFELNVTDGRVAVTRR